MAETAGKPEKPVSLGTFRVIGKHIIRASIVSLQMGMRSDGSPNIVQQAGPSERLEVGTELTDVQEHELKAFGDRLMPVDAAAQDTVVRLSGVEVPRGEEAPEQTDASVAMTGPTPSSPQDTPHPPVPGPPAEEPPAEPPQADRQGRATRTPEADRPAVPSTGPTRRPS